MQFPIDGRHPAALAIPITAYKYVAIATWLRQHLRNAREESRFPRAIAPKEDMAGIEPEKVRKDVAPRRNNKRTVVDEDLVDESHM